MHIFIAIWRDGTATLHCTTSRNAFQLFDSTDQFGSCDDADIYELITTDFSPCEFQMKRVRITDDMRIVRDRRARKNISERKK